MEGLRDAVFLEAGRAKGTGLKEALGSDALRAFYIYDRNTIGLGGPLQAGDESPSNVYDWADFVLNIGKGQPGHGDRWNLRLREDHRLHLRLRYGPSSSIRGPSTRATSSPA